MSVSSDRIGRLRSEEVRGPSPRSSTVVQVADAEKSKQQLIEELASLRQRVLSLEAEAAGRAPAAGGARHDLLSVSPAIIYTTKASDDYGCTFVSENLRAIMGYSPEEMTTDPKTWPEHLHPDDAPRVFEEMAPLMRQGGGSVEYRFRHRDGHYIWIQDTFRVVTDEAGQPVSGVPVCLRAVPHLESMGEMWLGTTEGPDGTVRVRELAPLARGAARPTTAYACLDVVLGRLEERRAKGKNDVALLPLPTGARDLKRLKPIFRYDAYRRHYGPGPATDAVLNGPIAAAVTANPQWLDEQLAQISAELAKTPRWVYASRDKGFDPDAPDADEPPPAPPAPPAAAGAA